MPTLCPLLFHHSPGDTTVPRAISGLWASGRARACVRSIGAGSFTAIWSLTSVAAILNASWSQNVTGTYTVNVNGTGTMTLTGPSRSLRDRRCGKRSSSMWVTDPAGVIVVGGSMVKQ